MASGKLEKIDSPIQLVSFSKVFQGQEVLPQLIHPLLLSISLSIHLLVVL